MTRRLVWCAIAALVMAMAPDARGGEPQLVSPRGIDVWRGELAAGGGRTVVLVVGVGRTRRLARPRLLARLGRGTRLGRPQRLDADVLDARVAVAADGTALAAWTDVTGRLRIAVAAPGHPFGRVQHYDALGLGGLAVTATGLTVVSWLRGEPGAALVQAAVGRPGHRFGAAVTLGESSYSQPALAVSPTGTVVLAWLSRPHPAPPGAPPLDGNPRVLAATLIAGAAAFAAPVQLAGPPSFVSAPFAAGGPGGAAVTWGEVTAGGGMAARIAVLGPDDGFTTIESPPGRARQPLTLVTRVGGALTALWLFGRDRLRTSFRAAGGAFSPAQQLSAEDWRAGPAAAVVVGQRTIATWSESALAHAARLRTAAQTAQGEWSAPRTLSVAKTIDHVVAATDRSRALIAWVERDRAARGRLYLTDIR